MRVVLQLAQVKRRTSEVTNASATDASYLNVIGLTNSAMTTDIWTNC